MPCTHCLGVDQLFDDTMARRDLRRLLRRGPSRTTRLLIEAVKGSGASLLDIGGGVGAIQHALAADGAERITSVDASRAYLHVAAEEAARRGYADRADHVFGDFVEVAGEVEPHDVVTLDRVICCYPDVDALVSASAQRARRIYAAVFPKDRWWLRAAMRIFNLVLRVRGSDYRAYVHPEERIESLVAAAGLAPATRTSTWMWEVRTWRRRAAA